MNLRREQTVATKAQHTDEWQARAVVMRTGIILGVGVVGAFDEIAFHQLLQWHNFYVHTTEYWRIVSDGIFNIFTATMLLWAALRLWLQRRLIADVAHSASLCAGTLLGMGGFQLYDGIVNHKLLRLHPIREGVVQILPYDLIWNVAAVLLLVAGWLVLRRTRAR